MFKSKNCLIGNLKFSTQNFKDIEDVYAYYHSKEFKSKNSIQRNAIINKRLIQLIQENTNFFCLEAVTNYLQYISHNSFLDGPYNLTAFERYLNQESQLNNKDKYLIRAKIIGKFIPRIEYQRYFPVGKDQQYYGTHTVTAHNPPDLDSTTASFIGWLDAFGCHVSESLTVWNVPKGKPSELITSFFEELFPSEIFTRIAKERSFISTVAMDIVKQDNLYRAQLNENIRELSHSRYKTHIIAVDKDGYYCGDWRISDIDAVSSIQRSLNTWFYFYEKEFFNKFFNLFTHRDVYLKDVTKVVDDVLNKPVLDLELNHDAEEKETLNKYLCLILNNKSGCKISKHQLFKNFDHLGKTNFSLFCQHILNLLNKENYCKDKKYILSRSQIFIKLEECHRYLHSSITAFRNYTEQLEVALKIKNKMLKITPQYVTTKSLIGEIQQLMASSQHTNVTVNYADKNRKLIPVGLLQRNDIDRSFLGTVSLRDFSNRDEIKLGDDVKVISIIDHHRSELSSNSIATIKIEDVQSCNILLAQEAFQINDAYPKKGRSLQNIEDESIETDTLKDELLKVRLQERLIREKQAILKKSIYYIDPQREIKEYLLFLNAIIDDTDLLIKAGWKDLYTISNLLNRIKSLQQNKTLEIIDITHIKPTHKNIRIARKLILKNDDMYSFYKKIYLKREKIINEIIKKTKNQLISSYFIDRKIQNSCCSVSQFKLFSSNWMIFLKNRNLLINKWLDLNKSIHLKTPEIDFFLQMNSTVTSYQEAYLDSFPNDKDKDEIWLSVDLKSDSALARLTQFIESIHFYHKSIDLNIFVEGKNDNQAKSLLEALNLSKILKATFKENNLLAESLVILSFKQAALNSRKADITPHLPR